MFVDFNNYRRVSTRGLPFFINKLSGDDFIGLQLGVGDGVCASYLLQACPLIKRYDLVDMYEPYEDFVGSNGYFRREDRLLQSEKPDFKQKSAPPHCSANKEKIKEQLITAEENILDSGMSERAKLHVMDSEEFLRTVEDETYDFIFLDAHMSYDQLYRDLKHWVPKVKKGGIVSGHDYLCLESYHAVQDYRKNFNVEDKLYRCHNNSFLWFKGCKRGVLDLGVDAPDFS